MPSAKQLHTRDAQADVLPMAGIEPRSSAAIFAVPRRHVFRRVVVPLMLVTSSMVMAIAWLGHLKYTNVSYAGAVFVCWMLVLPEYFLNISAIRLGFHVYTGAEMAAFRLCSGVACVAVVSAWQFHEMLTIRQFLGFALMTVAMALISVRQHDRFVDEEHATQEDGA